MLIFLNNTRSIKKQEIILPLVRFVSHELRINNEYLLIPIYFFNDQQSKYNQYRKSLRLY